MTSQDDRPATLRSIFDSDLVPGILFVLALALFTPRLAIPDRYVFDEVYHAYTAGQYAAGNADAYVWNTKAPRTGVAYMWNHPPVGVLIVAAAIRVWGDGPFGWRFASTLFGALGVVLAYLLARAMTRDRFISILAAGLLLLDGLYFTQSRIGMLDIFGTVLMLAALYGLHGYLTAPPDRVLGPLVRTGFFLGLAIATKWNAAYASILIGVVVLVRGWRSGRRAHLIAVPLGLIVVPVCVYGLAYVPFFLTGHDFAQFLELQRQIFRYHAHLTASHAYQSRWWEWPLTLRPVWYSAIYEPTGRVAHIYARGNSVLYLAFVPAVTWLSWRLWRRRDPSLVVLLIGFFGQWLPWALVPRIAFMYHFLPAVPFGCLALAVALVTAFRTGVAGRVVVIAYLALAVAFFVYFYPLAASVPITRQAVEHRMWLPSWR